MSKIVSLVGQVKIQDPANPEDITTWHGKTVMYFSPHEDDILPSAGTLALLTKNDNTVYVVLYTNGNKGTHDLDMKSERLAQIRKQEEIAAEKILGIPEENIFFLGYEDGFLEYVPPEKIVEKVCWLIRKYRPDAVFTIDTGEKYLLWHKTDHRACAMLTCDGARAAAYHLFFPQHLIKEGLQSITVRDWFFYETHESNYKVNITEVADLKWKAACQYASQFFLLTGIGSMKYTGPEMPLEHKEILKELMEKEADGKVYESFRRLQESLSF
jgi:LmbE family N-acetylglucosaminyl deacetylase